MPGTSRAGRPLSNFPMLLTLEESAARLCITEESLLIQVRSDKLRCIQIGKDRGFTAGDIAVWMAWHRGTTA